MTLDRRQTIRARLSLLLVTMVVVVTAGASGASGGVLSNRTTYYVNCRDGADSASGTTLKTPWRSLARVNATTFRPGDVVLLMRGVTCEGPLWPKGSGAPDAPISLGAYGAGAFPVIDGGTHDAAIQLRDQNYWEISDLETTGGSPYGILVDGREAGGVIRHIHLGHLLVHDVTGTPTKRTSGLVVFTTSGPGQRFEDVLVDNVRAHRTTQWSGISIAGSTWSADRFAGGADALAKGANIIVRKSEVHDVAGDGIVVHSAERVLIEHNVAFETGQAKASTFPTPNAIWAWNCTDCTMQFNEAYRAHSPDSQDGGAFDSDVFNTNVVIQYNYGHDSDGYCVGLFAVQAPDTNVNTTVRYNVCANNGRDPEQGWQGDFYYVAWDGGTIRNARAYNNVSYWNPADHTSAALGVFGAFSPKADSYFVNNIIYSTAPGMATLRDMGTGRLVSDYNVFWPAGGRTPRWQTERGSFSTLAAWQAATNMDAHSLVADPRLDNPSPPETGTPGRAFVPGPGSPARGHGWRLDDMGDRDFFGNALPSSGPVDIGAHQASGPRAR